MASDMIERTALVARQATQAAVSPRRGFTADTPSAEVGGSDSDGTTTSRISDCGVAGSSERVVLRRSLW